MEQQLSLFDFEDGTPTFEAFAQVNGETFWWASDFMHHLGYETWASFNKLINKAMTACNTLNIPLLENFKQVERIVDGTTGHDFKLSRFACYLIAMNGDTKKEPVAKAQFYFAQLAGAIENYMAEVQNVERLVIRDEISEGERSLATVAKMAKIENYGYFQSAGYRGMYNMNISQLKEVRRIPAKRTPLDFMGKDELAANLFRISQTELKIKEGNIQGQARLEATAETVGKKVRKTMLDISGVAPESLPKEKDIKEVRKALKAKNKEMRKNDLPGSSKKRLGAKRSDK